MVTGDVLFDGSGGDPKNADKEQLREIFRFASVCFVYVTSLFQELCRMR